VPSSEASRRFAPPQIPFTFPPLLRCGVPFRWSLVVLVVVRVQLDSRKDGPLDRHLVWRAHFVVSHLRIVFGFCGYTRIDRPNRRQANQKIAKIPPNASTVSFAPLSLSFRNLLANLAKISFSNARESRFCESTGELSSSLAKASAQVPETFVVTSHRVTFSPRFLLQVAKQPEKNRDEQRALKRNVGLLEREFLRINFLLTTFFTPVLFFFFFFFFFTMPMSQTPVLGKKKKRKKRSAYLLKFPIKWNRI